MTEIQEKQQCFYKDGFIYCNYIVRNGKTIQGRKGWLRFPAPSKKKGKNKITISM